MMVDADVARSDAVRARRRLRMPPSCTRHRSSETPWSCWIGYGPSRPGSASSVSATSGCRSPWSSRKPGFDVTGFDVDDVEDRADQQGPQLHPRRAERRRLRRGRKAGKLAATDRHVAARATWTSIDICVPTPLRKTQAIPDLSYVVQAVEAVARAPPARAAGDPRVDDVSRHDRRGGAADARSTAA